MRSMTAIAVCDDGISICGMQHGLVPGVGRDGRLSDAIVVLSCRFVAIGRSVTRTAKSVSSW